MPLTKRQKRRLSEISQLLSSIKITVQDLEKIQHDYLEEFNSAIDEICKQKKSHNKDDSVNASADLTVYEELSETKKENSREKSQKKEEFPPPEPKKQEGPEAPLWVKKLWKEIAKQCHPDRLNFQDLSAIEIAKRNTWFLESRKHFENREYVELLHIGVQLDIWLDDINHRTQYSMLENKYNHFCKEVQRIQSSHIWRWGNSWQNTREWIKIFKQMCIIKGIVPPHQVKLMKLYKKITEW